MDLFIAGTSRSPQKAGEIKTLVARELALGIDATVMVSELACMEEGCPPVETVIAVLRAAAPRVQFRLHRPMAEISAHDIRELCAQQANSSSEKIHGNGRN